MIISDNHKPMFPIKYRIYPVGVSNLLCRLIFKLKVLVRTCKIKSEQNDLETFKVTGRDSVVNIFSIYGTLTTESSPKTLKLRG